MGKILISAFADEYNRDPIKHAEFLRSRGVGYIEPRFVNGENFSEIAENEVKEYKNILDSCGIRVYSIGSPLGKISLSDSMDAHLELARRCFENTRLVGADRVRMFSFYLRDGETRAEARGEVVDRVGALLDLADTYGITLCHENEAKIYGEDAEHCLDLLETFSGRLRCVFDMGNFILDGVQSYPYAYKMLKRHIDYFHIKDSLSAGAIVPPGCGEASIKEILADYAKDAQSPFVVTLEPHLETFSGLNKLVGKSFENPYKFPSAEEAFSFALTELEKIVASIG
ncbi:MAG: sugar phosphate isomerase/epimerase [Clostridia bacterium]|nr:sugar phosphate isomerase/epimerase [Clostridia bacterium]